MNYVWKLGTACTLLCLKWMCEYIFATSSSFISLWSSSYLCILLSVHTCISHVSDKCCEVESRKQLSVPRCYQTLVLKCNIIIFNHYWLTLWYIFRSEDSVVSIVSWQEVGQSLVWMLLAVSSQKSQLALQPTQFPIQWFGACGWPLTFIQLWV
jgi:hypothetical protein